MSSRFWVTASYGTPLVNDRVMPAEGWKLHRFIILTSADIPEWHTLDLHPMGDLPGPKSLGRMVRTADKKGEPWMSTVRVTVAKKTTVTLYRGDRITSWEPKGRDEWRTLGKARKEMERDFAKECFPFLFSENS